MARPGRKVVSGRRCVAELESKDTKMPHTYWLRVYIRKFSWCFPPYIRE